MKGKIFLTNPAKSDLVEIWSYIAEENEKAADIFLDSVQTKATIIAGNPEIGRIRPELGPSLRSFPAEPYVLFYEPLQDGILIVRVLHGSRDIDLLF